MKKSNFVFVFDIKQDISSSMYTFCICNMSKSLQYIASTGFMLNFFQSSLECSALFLMRTEERIESNNKKYASLEM